LEAVASLRTMEMFRSRRAQLTGRTLRMRPSWLNVLGCRGTLPVG